MSKGIRQVCSNSALLCLLVAEIVVILFRYSNNIEGITIDENRIKPCQLAYDMTPFFTSTTSVLHAIDLFGEFYRHAGLKLNKTKTEAYLIEFQDPFVYNDNIGISWMVNVFKTLCTWFFLHRQHIK